jgi:DNA-binding PadR family transcriptional regulator
LKELTSTSFAVLGILAARPSTTYELATQVGRGLRFVWPRAVGRIYDEPKLLADHGLARARQEYTGRRPRTVYSITPKGRRSLRKWLAEPGNGPALEYEALLKVAYAAHGSKADLLGNIASVRGHAAAGLSVGRVRANEYANQLVPLPPNVAVNALMWGFLWRFYSALDDWAVWASAEVSNWPDGMEPTAETVANAMEMFRTALAATGAPAPRRSKRTT